MTLASIKAWLGFRPPKPAIISERGNQHVWRDGQWVEVCGFCGGNCGQCGTSVGRGVPASMDNMIKNLHR